MQDLTICRYHPDDAAPAAQLFYDAIHQGTQAFYTAEQRDAWASKVPETDLWQSRLAGQTCLMATRNQSLAGYMTLTPAGYIDLAYVAPDQMGTGVAAALYTALEDMAMTKNIPCLTTEASHLARRFFLRQGWVELQEQTIHRNGVALTNFRMEKRLA